MDDNFYKMLKAEKGDEKSFTWKTFFTWPDFAPRLAFASLTLIVGIAVGFFLRSPGQKNEQIELLGQEVSDLKELMMYASTSPSAERAASQRRTEAAFARGSPYESRLGATCAQPLQADRVANRPPGYLVIHGGRACPHVAKAVRK
jgi:hypothetical protein